jgi:hypothetical protein
VWSVGDLEKSLLVENMDEKNPVQIMQIWTELFFDQIKMIMSQFVHSWLWCKNAFLFIFCLNFRLCVNLEKNCTQGLCVL